MKKGSDLRAELKKGKPVIGSWLQVPSPDIAEIMGQMGYDWVATDMEHGAFTRADLPNIFRALELGGALPFARLLSAEPEQIKIALDSGARGLIFPMIQSRPQLDRAIEAALYPGGGGSRGVGFSRANHYGARLGEHLDPQAGLGSELILAAQIEQVQALPHLAEIFSHPRLDACMVGPYDLSASMGLSGQFEHPDFKAALEAIAAAARAAGLAMGLHIVSPDPELLKQKIDDGYSFIAYGIDALFLRLAARNPWSIQK